MMGRLSVGVIKVAEFSGKLSNHERRLKTLENTFSGGITNCVVSDAPSGYPGFTAATKNCRDLNIKRDADIKRFIAAMKVIIDK